MQIDILIDELTDCLVDRSSGRVLQTKYIARTTPFKRSENKGWKFKWNIPFEKGYTIYELFLEGDNTAQGRIALKLEGGVANVDIVETAPHNFGHDGKYLGVGGHLFAIACKISYDAGFDGVVAFDTKSNLVEYYKRELEAVEIYSRRMVIFEDAAQILLQKYFGK